MTRNPASRLSAPFDLASDLFQFDPQLGCWTLALMPSRASFSDGDEVEQRLHRIIRAAADVSSSSLELRDQIEDWPSLYHLSPLRSNLLRPIAHLLRGEILEMGAGCGALTRFLGEHAASVTAVEATPQRAAIAAARCRDLSNVHIVAAPFDLCPQTPSFDAVLLVGVLEYAPKFFESPDGDPVDRLLEAARAFLKPNGVLVVAIENQLGLKYFAGANEDHYGVPMTGIEDRYSAANPITFGQEELRRRLVNAGFPVAEWLFPFPDYKFPVSILTERAVEMSTDADLTPLLAGSVRSDPQGVPTAVFSLERAWGPVFRNGLAGRLANSFLVVAGADSSTNTTVPALAYHYAAGRRPAFCKQAEFLVQHGDIVVQSSRLFPDRHAPAGSLSQHLTTSRFHRGVVWQTRLIEIVNEPGWHAADLVDWARTWVDAVIRESALTNRPPTVAATIPGRLLDAVPRNMILSDDATPVFFDLEWHLDRDVELGCVLVRGLLDSLASLSSVAPPADDVPREIKALLKTILQAMAFEVDDHRLHHYAADETDLQQRVYGGRQDALERIEKSVLRVRTPLAALVGALAREKELRVHAQNLAQAEAHANSQVKALEDQLLEAHSRAAEADQAARASRTEADALAHRAAAAEAAAAQQQATNDTLREDLQTRDAETAALQTALGVRDSESAALRQVVAVREGELHTVITSRSWKITRPLRVARRFAQTGRLRVRVPLTAATAATSSGNAALAHAPAPAAPPTPSVNPGWCTCCRSDTEFVENGPWLREEYRCARCGSIPRFRAVNLTLDKYFPGWEELSLHESSPSNDFIRRYSRAYSSSYFFEGVTLGSNYHGSRCEDLEQLTFADNTFDLFITQDVFEHVFHPDRAMAEIMRVIKPGGAHVFTAPKHKGLRLTTQRARLEDGDIIHLLDPQYHGNPIGDGRALVTWDYGDDFEMYLWRWCGYPTVTYVARDRHLGIDGEYLEVFVTRKTAGTAP